MKKKPYINKLQDENKELRKKLSDMVALFDFVPDLKGIAVDWTNEDAEWLQNILTCASGEKLTLLLNGIQAFMQQKAVRAKSVPLCYQADAFREVVSWFHFFTRTSRTIEDEKQNKHSIRSKDALTHDELGLRINEIVKSRITSYGDIG